LCFFCKTFFVVTRCPLVFLFRVCCAVCCVLCVVCCVLWPVW
jgi:hypothetical protein